VGFTGDEVGAGLAAGVAVGSGVSSGLAASADGSAEATGGTATPTAPGVALQATSAALRTMTTHVRIGFFIGRLLCGRDRIANLARCHRREFAAW
jgi:hypothetical protein